MARRNVEIRFNQPVMDRILESPQVIEATRQVAERGMAAIVASAPEDTGAYKRGFRLESRKSRFRTVWRIVGRDSKTVLIESRRGVVVRAMKGLRSRG